MCDFCGFWQHCVCMGFTSLKDRRIPKDSFQCYHCKYPQTNSTIQKFLNSYCLLRRAIAFAVHEGISGIASLMKKLNVARPRGKAILDRLVKEGIVVKLQERDICSRKFNRFVYETVRDEKAKKTIRDYFLVPMEEISKFKKLLNEAPLLTEEIAAGSNDKKVCAVATLAADEHSRKSPSVDFILKKDKASASKKEDRFEANSAQAGIWDDSIRKLNDMKIVPSYEHLKVLKARMSLGNDGPKSKRIKVSVPIEDIKLNFKPCT